MVDHHWGEVYGLDARGGIHFEELGREESCTAGVVEDVGVREQGEGGGKEGDCVGADGANAGAYGGIVSSGDGIVEFSRISFWGVGGG